jgi:hypothetical protein
VELRYARQASRVAGEEGRRRDGERAEECSTKAGIEAEDSREEEEGTRAAGRSSAPAAEMVPAEPSPHPQESSAVTTATVETRPKVAKGRACVYMWFKLPANTQFNVE